MDHATATHPSHDELKDFGLGRVDETAAAVIEEHLADCDACRKFVEDLPSDSFIQLLQDTNAGLEPARPGDTPSLPPLYKKLAAILQPEETASAEPPAEPEAIPEELRHHSRYRLLGRLGSGGMGTVFKARHTMMERDVALKIMNPELLDRPKAVEQFRQEVKAAAQLAHTNIVTAHDAETVGSLHFLVMEYVAGKNLAHVIDERRILPIAVASDYARQTAVGLQHAHERGMVHRDIKPHNLILTPQGQVKILDFGLARFRSETRAASGGSEHAVLMGSPDYMSPEQARDARQADIRADIYSLGCTLYQLLTGLVPFPGGSTFDKIAAHLEKTPTSVRSIRPDVPVELARVLDKMMAKDPSARFQTPGEAAAALEPFVESPRAAMSRRPAARRNGPIAVAACGVALLLFVSLLFGPTILRYTTNRGQLVIETDDRDVELVVKRGGERVHIIDTKTQKEIVLHAGRYELDLGEGAQGVRLVTREFTLERGGKTIVRVRLEPLPPPLAAAPADALDPPPVGALPDAVVGIGDRRLQNSVGTLRLAAVQQELKLSPEQIKRITAVATPNMADDEFQKLLSAEQQQRFRQIQLQRTHADIDSGPLGIFRSMELVEGLHLTEEQRVQLSRLGEERRRAFDALVRGQPRPEGWRPHVDELDDRILSEIDALLSDNQKLKLKEVLGPPVAAAVLDTRGFGPPSFTMFQFRVGESSVRYNGALLKNSSVQQELKLTAEQKSKAAALPLPRLGGQQSTPESELAAILDPEQLRRFRQITYQPQSFDRTKYGPMSPYRYREFIEPLGLSPEQKRRIEEVAMERQREYSSSLPRRDKSGKSPIGDSLMNSQERAKKLAELDRRADEALKAVLTFEQRAKADELLGPPFALRSERSRPAPAAGPLTEARKLFNEAKYAEAIAACGEALKLDPDDADAYLVRGQCYAWQQEHVKAVAEFSAALRLKHPSAAEVFFWRAYSHLNLRAFDACLADSAELFKRNLNPGLRQSGLLNRAWALASLGEYEKALADYEEVLKSNPQAAQAYFTRSLVFKRLGDLPKADADMAAALKLDADAAKKWAHFDQQITAPAPLHYWLRGRTVLRVAQDGSQPYRTIQQALDAVKPGEAIQIMDQGPYRELPRMQRAVENIGLISEVGTRIEIPAWLRFEGADKKLRCAACVLLCPNGLRLSGIHFVLPPVPADAEWSWAVDIPAAGEVTVEHCRVIVTPSAAGQGPPERCTAMLLGWVGGDAHARARFLVQDCSFDGDVGFKNDFPAKVLVQRNRIRCGRNAGLVLPEHALEVIVRHNVLQGFNGIIIRARDRGQPVGTHLIHNNTIDAVNCPIFEEGAPGPKNLPPAAKVRIQNNILRSQSGSGIEIVAAEHKIVLDAWKIEHNCYSTAPKPIPGNFHALPHGPTDVLTAAQFLSVDPAHPNYLRIAADTPLANAGLGGDLPRYLGALPPGPPPKDGDWFTRLQVARKVMSATDELEEGRRLANAGKFFEAVAAYSRALALDPSLAAAYHDRGVAHCRLGEHRDALADFATAISKKPPSLAHTLAWNASALSTLFADEACIAAADECLRQNPSEGDKVYVLGARAWSRARQGNYEEALHDYAELEKLQKLDAVSYFARSKIHNRLRDFDNERADHAKAMALDRNVEKAQAHLADQLLMPPPLAAWRRGRNILRVSQDGKSPYGRIGDALHAARAGDVIEVLDKGPYREALVMNRPVDDLSLISEVGARIEVPAWNLWGKSAGEPARMIYQGCVFLSTNGFRLYGLEFVVPAARAAKSESIAVDLQAAGDVAVENCRVVQALPAVHNTALLIGWNGSGSIGRGRFVVRNNSLDGALAFKQNFPSQVLVQHNWLRSPGNAVQLPFAEGRCTVRHNLIEGGNGVVIRERFGGKNLPPDRHRYDIVNNTIDAANCPLWCFVDAHDAAGVGLCRYVRIQNNILHSGAGTGIEAYASDHASIKAHWRLGWNSYGSAPKVLPPNNLPTVGHTASDQIVAAPFLSLNSKHADFRRIAVGGPLATAGHGLDLPAYIGAFPPGPVPKDGDWFTRLAAGR